MGRGARIRFAVTGGDDGDKREYRGTDQAMLKWDARALKRARVSGLNGVCGGWHRTQDGGRDGRRLLGLERDIHPIHITVPSNPVLAYNTTMKDYRSHGSCNLEMATWPGYNSISERYKCRSACIQRSRAKSLEALSGIWLATCCRSSLANLLAFSREERTDSNFRSVRPTANLPLAADHRTQNNGQSKWNGRLPDMLGADGFSRRVRRLHRRTMTTMRNMTTTWDKLLRLGQVNCKDILSSLQLST
nr:hypothetical protein CFP56_68120 [Quercus suber]